MNHFYNLSKKYLSWMPIGICLFIIVVLRILWPIVAEWREDQSSVVWIATHFPIYEWTVGLPSSVGLTTPNGMLFVSYIGGLFPNLYWTGLFYQSVQIGLILYFISGLAQFDKNVRPIWAFVIIASSFVMGATGSEVYCQYIMIWVNLIFFGTYFRFKVNPTKTGIAVMFSIILMAPAIYIAGAMNSLLFTVLLATTIYLQRNIIIKIFKDKNIWFILIVISLCFAVYIWIPYFKYIQLQQINLASQGPLVRRIFKSIYSLFLFPYTLTVLLNNSTFGPSPYIDFAVTNNQAFKLIGVVQYLLWIIIVVGGIAISIIKKIKTALFLWLVVALFFSSSTLLGGPSLISNRTDILLQIIPLVLAAITVVISYFPRWKWFVICWAIFNLGASAISITELILSQPTKISDDDIPLMFKRKVISFIANDWLKTHSSLNPVPIFYDVGGGRWDWIPNYGKTVSGHYHNPYTMGRGFDYSLEKEFNMKNSQEGIQLRSPLQNGYIVNYSWEKAPQTNYKTQSVVIGGYRVSYPTN